MTKELFKFYVKVIRCPFCKHAFPLNEEVTKGQMVHCSDCDTQFEMVSEIEGEAITNIIPNNIVRFKVGDSYEDFDKETLQELISMGVVKVNDQEGLILTEKGIEAAKKIKELKKEKT